jgi:hypothetical protein
MMIEDKEEDPVQQTSPVKHEVHVHSAKPTSTSDHKCRSWEKTCPGCGAPNPDYVAPDLFCESCSVPTGNVPEGFKVPGFFSDPVELPEIPPCWNCGCTKMVYRKTGSLFG